MLELEYENRKIGVSPQLIEKLRELGRKNRSLDCEIFTIEEEPEDFSEIESVLSVYVEDESILAALEILED